MPLQQNVEEKILFKRKKSSKEEFKGKLHPGEISHRPCLTLRVGGIFVRFQIPTNFKADLNSRKKPGKVGNFVESLCIGGSKGFTSFSKNRYRIYFDLSHAFYFHL